jgi:hypothetical protein
LKLKLIGFNEVINDQREQKASSSKYFGIFYQFSAAVSKRLDKSWSLMFRQLVFEKIDESHYAVCFSIVAFSSPLSDPAGCLRQ